MKTKHLFLTSAVIAMVIGAMLYGPDVIAGTDQHAHAHPHDEGEQDHQPGKKGGHDHAHAQETATDAPHDHGDEHEEGVVKLSPEQMVNSGISTVPVRQGSLSDQVSVPGRIVADANRMAQIVPKVSGIVIEARKNLGDHVEKGEVLALIESREMAEAAAEHQAAIRSSELARTTYNREKTLWEKKITAQQDYLSAKNAWQEARIRLDLAKQKLEALGGHNEKGTPSRYHELRSPLKGRIIERDLTLGAFADTSVKAFTVADLSVLWVETAITPNDLPRVQEGQTAIIESNQKQSEGKLIFVSPAIDPNTRSAKAIVELQNPDGQWRSGDYANVAIVTSMQQSGMTVPLEAIQTIEGKTVVFVKTQEGFEKRDVVTGKKDSMNIEILSGLKPRELIATGNTFVLKADIGKSEAEHSH